MQLESELGDCTFKPNVNAKFPWKGRKHANIETITAEETNTVEDTATVEESQKIVQEVIENQEEVPSIKAEVNESELPE